jgi:hypothetical protein
VHFFYHQFQFTQTTSDGATDREIQTGQASPTDQVTQTDQIYLTFQMIHGAMEGTASNPNRAQWKKASEIISWVKAD